MKKRIGFKSENGDALLPMTEADVTSMASKKARPRPPGAVAGGRRKSRFWGFKVLVPLLAGLSLCLVLFLHFTKSHRHAEIIAARLSPWKEYLHNRISRHHNKKKKTSDSHHKHLNRNDEEDGRRKQHNLDKERLKKIAHGAQLERVAKEQRMQQQNLPLYKFESLRYALQKSELVLLYFAASWCPMSAPVTDQLDSLFRDILIPPASIQVDSNDKNKLEDAVQRLVKDSIPPEGISLVYVSSDKSQGEMKDYQKTNWMVVPYDSPDRNNLKRHFETCAKIEMESLGIKERQGELPSLIVISGASHQVLTMDGVDHIKDKGQKAVDYWFELLKKKKQEESESATKSQ